MTRVATFMAVTLFVTAVASGFAVVLGRGALPLTAGSVVVAYAALATPPVEASFTAMLVGLVVDALAGASLGASSFSLLVTLLLTRLGEGFVPSTRDRSAYAFVLAFAFVQALLASALLALVGPTHRGLALAGAVQIAVVDAVAAVMIFPLLHAVFVLLRLEDRSATLRERLQAR
jgi:cell shape-determining protein MreD